MNSIATDLNIILEKSQWDSFVKHMIFLCGQYRSTDMKIGDHFIDLRRISPVPRRSVLRIFFDSNATNVIVFRAKIFSLDGSEVLELPDQLKQDVQFIFEDCILKK